MCVCVCVCSAAGGDGFAWPERAGQTQTRVNQIGVLNGVDRMACVCSALLWLSWLTNWFGHSETERSHSFSECIP